MTLREIAKRMVEHLSACLLRPAIALSRKKPYSRFARGGKALVIRRLPGASIPVEWKDYRIYLHRVDLTKPIDWHCSETESAWPEEYFSKINYRPGNPNGDIRVNWELNRLQFLPPMAVCDEGLAIRTIESWLGANPYLYGPSYSSSMEVALRWISVYWAVCLLKTPPHGEFATDVEGLAFASGRFISRRLSTYSSAGNHLIIEAVGLFWAGKAVEGTALGKKWLRTARSILWEEIPRQISADGTGREQSFWYLGFVLDAVLHYLLLEDGHLVPQSVRTRVESAVAFIGEMIGRDGSFFDYGDRDDGFVFRGASDYRESPFPGLVSVARLLLGGSSRKPTLPEERERLRFWGGDAERGAFQDSPISDSNTGQSQGSTVSVDVRTFEDGGMTLMKRGRGRLLFRHAALGLEPTYAHGHADALALLLFWADIPVLIDPGTGPYNTDLSVRNYFRSTLAHNTVEIEKSSQAEMLGPFMWRETYGTGVTHLQTEPHPAVEAYHTGYEKRFKVVHNRKIEWKEPKRISITDRFSGRFDVISYTGAFHLGNCKGVDRDRDGLVSQFDGLRLFVRFPSTVDVQVHCGSLDPFFGWRSRLYGGTEPGYAITFSSTTARCPSPETILEIREE